jgi:2-amino-4-hydroxy-6-hydroxymethyldihydropteridine diphosphokinase
MTLAFIGLGSNLAHPRRQIARAVAHSPAAAVAAWSRVVELRHAPIGCPTAARLCQRRRRAGTALPPPPDPRGCAHRAAPVRRDRSERNAPRTLDLDLLLYGRRRIACRSSRCRIRGCTSAVRAASRFADA